MIKELVNYNVVLFGAGRIGMKMLTMLIDNGIKPMYFVDNNHSLRSIEYNGINGQAHLTVKSPEALLCEDRSALNIIISVHGSTHRMIKSQLEQMGLGDCIYSESRICPVCCNEVDVFFPFGSVLRRDAQCPQCNALERHRAIWLCLKSTANLNIVDAGKKNKAHLLHFAPEKVFYDKFSALTNIDYYPVDVNPSFEGIRDIIDIQSIGYPDSMFDIIICSHVLEHVPNDNMAMREMRRVLKKDGTAYISVPIFDSEATYEDPLHNSPELRLKHYGQDDHLRMYGMDFPDKLADAGFNVEVVDFISSFTNHELYRYGLNSSNEKVYICTVSR